MLNNSGLPKITIVTPSYNQGQYIEKTILSVVNQGYKNFEYIVIDGGSKDGTIEVIKKYEKYLSYWCSEKDSGQSNAINKGFSKATGDILVWLNSDDWFEPSALLNVANAVKDNPECSVFVGYGRSFDTNGVQLHEYIPEKLDHHAIVTKETGFMQPSCFFKKTAFDSVEGIDESLHYVMDFDLWLRLIKKNNFFIIKEFLSGGLAHDDCKTCNPNLAVDRMAELIAILLRHDFNEGMRHLKSICRVYNIVSRLPLYSFFRNFIFKK